MELWRLRRFASNACQRIWKLVTESRFYDPTALGGMTLGADDVKIARNWLTRTEEWDNDESANQFHKEFAKWNGSGYAFSFASGRVALSACLNVLQLSPDDEVIIPGYTCVVVDNAVRFAGLCPVYCDIELDTYGLDAHAVKKLLSKNTKAVILQHLYGLVSRDYEQITTLARMNGIYVIEDCAHSTGAKYKGQNVGNRGDLAFYSSEQSKAFCTIQGGVAITNNERLGNALRNYWELSNYPRHSVTEKLLKTIPLLYYSNRSTLRWFLKDFCEMVYGKYLLESTTRSEIEGEEPKEYRSRMPGPLASVATNQIRKLNGLNEKRRKTAIFWAQWCLDNGYVPAKIAPNSEPIYLRYPVLVDPMKKQNRDWATKELGIELGVWFTSNLHPRTELIPYCPNAAIAVERCINFPCIGIPVACPAQ